MRRRFVVPFDLGQVTRVEVDDGLHAHDGHGQTQALQQLGDPLGYDEAVHAKDVLRRARATFGCDFVQFYGMTESAGGGSYLSPSAHDLPGKLTSCGQPWPGAAMAILDGEGRELGDGEIGERLHLSCVVTQRLVHKGGNAGTQAQLRQFAVHGGGSVDHHRIRSARQQRIDLGKTLANPVLARQFAEHRGTPGTEQRGDSLVVCKQRQIGLLGDIAETYEGNAHGNSLS